jgi:putative addiction module killer protein
MSKVVHYCTEEGKDVFADWVRDLCDQQAATRIAARLERLRLGLFGDCKELKESVWELRVDWGPGYRIYYACAGPRLTVVLCGGDKRKQSADIERAVRYWKDWKTRRK